MAPGNQKFSWEDFGYKTAEKASVGIGDGARKYGFRIATLAAPEDEGGDGEPVASNSLQNGSIDIAGLDVHVPHTVPEEHWPDYADFKDDLKLVIELLKKTEAAKKKAEEEVKKLEDRVAELEKKASGEDINDLKKERDQWKTLYEAEAEQVRKRAEELREILPSRARD